MLAEEIPTLPLRSAQGQDGAPAVVRRELIRVLDTMGITVPPVM
ncbi:MAG: hypothetical protein ACE14M_11430 [Terriglobales bacterium]